MNDICSILCCPSLAIFGDIGGAEVLVVLGAILVLFGGKGMPGIARTMGKITKDLQRASQDFKDQLLQADQLDEPVSPPSEIPEWEVHPPGDVMEIPGSTPPVEPAEQQEKPLSPNIKDNGYQPPPPEPPPHDLAG